MFDHPHILVAQSLVHDYRNNAYATQYVKPDSRTYYKLASCQTTIVDVGDLNANGQALFAKTEAAFERGEIKDTFLEYCFTTSNSGFWTADRTSAYFSPKETTHTMLNSWNNICVTGQLEKRGECVTSSPFLFRTDQWCLTHSGSLYALGTKVHRNVIYSSKYMNDSDDSESGAEEDAVALGE